MKVLSTSPYIPKLIKSKHTKNISLYYCLNILHRTEVRGFYALFGKPVNGQRTGSNAKTAAKVPNQLYAYKYNLLKGNCGGLLTKPIFLSEYINLFWQQQWVFEWVSSYKLLKRLPVYLRKTQFIDIANISTYNMYSFYSNPFKSAGKLKQKRRKTIPKNKYPTGFIFGFSIIYKNQLNHIL